MVKTVLKMLTANQQVEYSKVIKLDEEKLTARGRFYSSKKSLKRLMRKQALSGYYYLSLYYVESPYSENIWVSNVVSYGGLSTSKFVVTVSEWKDLRQLIIGEGYTVSDAESELENPTTKPSEVLVISWY